MTNNSVQEIRYVLWVLEATRRGTNLTTAENIRDILAEEGYPVDLQRVNRIRTDLEKLIPSPWMIDTFLPERARNQLIRKAFLETAERIKKNKKIKQPEAEILKRIFSKRVTRTSAPQKNWKGELEYFLRQPFAKNEIMSPTLRVIHEAMSALTTQPTQPLSRGAREILAEIRSRPPLVREIKRAFAYRTKFNKIWNNVALATARKIEIIHDREEISEYKKASGSLIRHKAASKKLVQSYRERRRVRR